MPIGLPFPALALTAPHFTLQAIITVTPVLVLLIVVQSNLPSVIFLRSQGYHPPERIIDAVGGIATSVGSLFGPTAVSLALPLVSLAAAPEAGEFSVRHRAVYVAAGALVLIALLAGAAAVLPAIIPLPLLLTLAGLSLEPVLAGALRAITRGPLLLGPLFAFRDCPLEAIVLWLWALLLVACLGDACLPVGGTEGTQCAAREPVGASPTPLIGSGLLRHPTPQLHRLVRADVARSAGLDPDRAPAEAGLAEDWPGHGGAGLMPLHAARLSTLVNGHWCCTSPGRRPRPGGHAPLPGSPKIPGAPPIFLGWVPNHLAMTPPFRNLFGEEGTSADA